MRARLLLAALAAGVPLGLAGTANAEPCVLATGLPANGYAIVCVDQNDCLLYQYSRSDAYKQVPICVG